MKVFRILDIGIYSQIHCVVADSFAEAEALWEKKYGNKTKSIEIYSDYVIVKEPK